MLIFPCRNENYLFLIIADLVVSSAIRLMSEPLQDSVVLQYGLSLLHYLDGRDLHGRPQLLALVFLINVGGEPCSEH